MSSQGRGQGQGQGQGQRGGRERGERSDRFEPEGRERGDRGGGRSGGYRGGPDGSGRGPPAGQGRGGSVGPGRGGPTGAGRGGSKSQVSQLTFHPNQPSNFPQKEWSNGEKRQRKAVQGQGQGQGQTRAGKEKEGKDDGLSCIVCYKDVKYYSVAACDHAVCFECSARMKVLLEQNECPICRQPAENVVFTRGPHKYRELKDKLRMFIYLPKWGIYLEDEGVKDDFDRLLEHRCPFCPDQFDNFAELSTHANRKHQMFACALCTENIKVFGLERQFYNRQDLAIHKRKGDRNDTSHKGHPLCEFCDRRYFDHDELFKHLRKDHYFCHFCDADGFNHYYNTYDDLRIHFRKEHFLCEEENCKHEQFTSVFRSDIDMKAHLTQVHSRLLGKHGMKQARIIDVEFNRDADEERKSRRFNRDGFVGRGTRRDRGGGPIVEEDMSQPYFEPTIHEKPKVDSVADFPTLDGATAMLPASAAGNGNTQTTSASGSSSSIAQKVALSSGLNVGGLSGGGQGPKWNARSRQDEEFPALGGPSNFDGLEQTASQQRPFASAAVLKKPISAPTTKPSTNGLPRGPRPFQEEFPSLGNSKPSNGSAWIGSGVKMKGKSTPRTLKVAPAPLERKVEIDTSDSFNFVPLSATRARKDSLTKKYESILASEEDFPVMEKVEDDAKLKKKKKAKDKDINDSAKSKALAATALFNGGKARSCKDKLPEKKLDPKEDFPSLEKLKTSVGKISETTSNPNIAGISLAGPPPGFSSMPRPSSSSDLFSTILATPIQSNNNKGEDLELELLKARAGATGKLYTQPPGFTRRTQQLMGAIKSSLNQDEGAFEMFKSVSNQYKKGEISSKEYYELCQDMFGMSDFRLIFPELLTLLPEIEKQQELLAVHRRAGGPMRDLASCKECFQVVKSGDLTVHTQEHGDSQLFPAL